MRFDVSGEEIREKDRRIVAFLAEQNLSGLIITGTRNFAWATCGRDNHVVKGSDGGVGHALYTADGGKYILCDNIEEARLKEEEGLEAQGFRFVTGAWHTFDPGAEAARITGSGTLAADTMMGGAKLTIVDGSELAPLRYELTPAEIERYKWLGSVTGEAMTVTAQAIDPGMTEHEVGAVLDHFLQDEGVTPYLTLVASDERIAKYRHPIPTDKAVERLVMYVTCAQAFGLIACATRIVSFGSIGSDLKKRHEACCLVDTVFNLSSKPGASIADVFEAGQEAYAARGYGDEWGLHHQGGATGYAGRDYKAVPGMAQTVRQNQAFAWNPSITGTKTEDTIIATADGPVVLTPAPDFPTVKVETSLGVMDRPAIWER
ncbi:MAG: M24 family metallopeptidase [Akkermansiaceae bacterium]|nr:M24 family metallopeptidase [Armatimonadota bacterium]